VTHDDYCSKSTEELIDFYELLTNFRVGAERAERFGGEIE
jgi:hypothetical protein